MKIASRISSSLAPARRGAHVHLQALVRARGGGGGDGQKLRGLGLQAAGPQSIEVLEGGEDHELRAAGHDPQDEGHDAQHLLGVVEDVLLQGVAVPQEGFDEGLCFRVSLYLRLAVPFLQLSLYILGLGDLRSLPRILRAALAYSIAFAFLPS